MPPLEAHHSSQDKAKKRKTQNSQFLSKFEYSLSTIKFQSELYKLSTFIYSLEVLKMQAKWHTNEMKFGANLDNEGSVTFLPRLAPPRLLSTVPPRLPYYLHLFITFTPLFYKRNKKSHFIILLSQSSCHAPSKSLGLGPLLGLDPLMGLGPLLGLGFMALSILYLVSITTSSFCASKRLPLQSCSK